MLKDLPFLFLPKKVALCSASQIKSLIFLDPGIRYLSPVCLSPRVMLTVHI